MAETGHNMLDIKNNNRSTILKFIHKLGMLSRKDLSELMGLTPASLTINVNEMLDDNLLYVVKEDEAKNVGRKKILVDINYDYKKIIGINIDKDYVSIYLGTMNLVILDKIDFKCKTKDSLKLIELINEKTNELLKKNKLITKDILGIGISLVGITNKYDGISIRSWDILEKEFPIANILEKKIMIPCYIENNVRSMAQANKFLNYPIQSKNFIFLKFENGIGTAIDFENQFYEGETFKSGELGHVFVANNDITCRCQKIGCLETVASTWRLKEILGEHITNEEILKKYNENDEFICNYLNNGLKYLAIALSNYIVLFDPSEVILYGYLFESKNIYQKLLQNIAQIINKPIDETKIKVSNNNLKLEGVGAISIVVKEFLDYGGKK